MRIESHLARVVTFGEHLSTGAEQKSIWPQENLSWGS